VTVAGDLRTLEACEQVFARVNEHFKRCDVLVNSAAATLGGNFFEQSDALWTDSFALKFHATVRRGCSGRCSNRSMAIYARAGFPHRRCGQRGDGKFRQRPHCTRQPDDININVIHSGQTQTGRVEQLFQQFAKAQNKTVDQVRAESLSKSGLRRIGQPQDIAALTVFLRGAQARHIHGTAIAVDGGGTPGYYKAMIRFTISIARRSRVSEASGVRNAAWADNVTFSSCASG
jgi:NAD(P)-dependent dehydrogenase (short-subunit alcohol dehydrogenase family)